jgi:hypothetical protein
MADDTENIQCLREKVAVLEERISGSERSRLEIKDIYERQAEFDRAEAKAWRDASNEWRLAMKDREAQFQTQAQAGAEKERLEAAHTSLTGRVEVIEKRHATDAGGGAAMTRLWLAVAGMISLVGVIIAAIFHFIPNK